MVPELQLKRQYLRLDDSVIGGLSCGGWKGSTIQKQMVADNSALNVQVACEKGMEILTLLPNRPALCLTSIFFCGIESEKCVAVDEDVAASGTDRTWHQKTRQILAI